MPRGRGIYQDEDRDKLKDAIAKTTGPEKETPSNKVVPEDGSSPDAQEPPD
jgi:hypothetical protein